MSRSRLLTAGHLARAFAVGLALLIAASPALAADDPAPVPARDAQAPALAALKKEFKAELKSKAPEDRAALANVFIERAGQAGDDAAARYVFLDEAVGLATDAKDVQLALEAVDRLALSFDVEKAALSFAALNGMTRGAKDPGLLAEVASACIDVTGVAMSEGDAGTAGKAITAAKSLSKKAKMDGLAARAAELAKLVTSFKRGQAAAATAITALAETPDVAALHLVAGRGACFGLGDWEQGLAHLAKCGVAPIVALAQQESGLGAEGDVETRVELAKGWWAAAESEKDPLARARMLARAAAHYDAALPALDENAAGEIRKRLDSITFTAWDRGVALTTDFSKFGPANLALATLRAFIKKQDIDTNGSAWRTKLPRFPDVKYAPGVDYFWRLETNQGEITIRFFTDNAPQHVTNFIYLTELGFFDGLTFHRVIPGFMAQGGDPTGSGSGGPGYFIDGEYSGPRKHEEPGVLSMANTGSPKSDGSQFFITFRPTPELDGKHTVFGEVVDGMKTVKKLEELGTPGGPPKTKLVIERATVFMK